jgi:homopolymeric O-antigen transport system permease protein
VEGSAVTVALTSSRRSQLTGLLWTLIRTDFKTRYHGSLQGFFWALLKPFAMFLVLMAVFSLIFRSDPNYSLNLIVGLFLWDFFADATKTAMTSLLAKGYLLTKARLPAWIFVVSSISNATITLIVFTGIILGYLAVTGRFPPVVNILLFGYYLLQYVLIVIGIGLATSVLFLRYRDLNQVWDVVTQAGFFVAPIIYPLRIIPEHLHRYLYLWPPTPVVQFGRAVLIDQTVPSARAHVYLTVGAALILLTGIAIFGRRARRAMESL